jgi:hypothetical protein
MRMMLVIAVVEEIKLVEKISSIEFCVYDH